MRNSMKRKILFCLLCGALCCVFAFAGTSDSERKALARKLYGRIQIVDTAGDYRVQVVDAAPDLRVKIVDAFPNSPGEWKLVDTAGDYRVQFVHAFGDIRVKFVDAFPGVEE